MRTYLILVLALSLGAGSACAGDVPAAVTRLALAYAATAPAGQDNGVQAYADAFFDGYMNPYGSIETRSALHRDAFAAGQSWWRDRPGERDAIITGYGYQRVEVDGTWTRDFERSDFEPKERTGEQWWLSPLGDARWPGPDVGSMRVHVSGYLSKPGRHGHLGMYDHELLAGGVTPMAPIASPAR